MTLPNLQKWVADDWKHHSSHMPSVEMQLLYIIEEFGEVAEALRKQQGHKARKQVGTSLGSELADLIVSITTLANHFEIDLDAEIELFKKRLAERHANGF